MSESPPVLLLFGALLVPINENLFRVADQQSIVILVSSLFMHAFITTDAQWVSVVALWVAFSPIGVFLLIQQVTEDGGLTGVSVHKPFDHVELSDAMNNFLLSIGKGERAYVAFNDPDNRYKNIFDGYRVIHELTLFVAAEKEIHVFPDWYAVLETNFEGAEQCWGRSVQAVTANCKRWDAKFAIIYQQTGTDLQEHWLNDFIYISEFDWGDYLTVLGGTGLWSNKIPAPKFFLLKRAKITA